MIRRSLTYQNVPFKISLGFSGTALLYVALTHSGMCYLSLLGLSAFHKRLPIKQIRQSVRYLKPVYASTGVALLSLILLVLMPSSASAQWNNAQTAAQTSLSGYIGADVVTLLFTVVFLLIFFLIMGGLMAWGYKAFRNEDAAVPMTSFIVGTVIFVGGEVFSNLLFSGGATTPVGPPAPGI